jgi:hypothetical protein
MIASNNLYNKGFYQVGEQIFFSKFQAIVASQQTGHFPEWNFNNDVFAQWDWTVEPTEDLWEIYRQRAQQLRDNYDYIVLMFSGGSDSTNILQSFLFNNIPIDEIFLFGPFSTNMMQVNTAAGGADAVWRELDTVALPYLNQLSKNHKFKVTTYDYTDDLLNKFNDVDWIYTDVGSRFNPMSQARNHLFDRSSTALAQLNAGKKVCFISGIDKPRVILKDGVFYFAFLDHFLSLGTGQKYLIDGKQWFVEELFYWTPDMPKLIIKQAHVMMNYFKKHPERRYLIDRADLGDWKHRQTYFELAKSLMYPYWNGSTFQAGKPDYVTFMELDNWFINSNHRSRDHWLAGVKEAQRIIDPYWISQDNDPKLTGSWSKFYQLGTINQLG